MKKILIYNDSGAHPRGVELLVRSLKEELIDSISQIDFIDRHDLIGEKWQDSCQVLIFPGGRDIPYQQALYGLPNQNIRKFVEMGGSYLGLCAGAYYASCEIEFESGTPLEIIESRQLSLFPGIARGPAYGVGRFRYSSEEGALIAKILLTIEAEQDQDSDIIPHNLAASYYNGGCSFINAETYPNTTVLARYADLKDKPAAIIECNVGAGKAILSGIHFEYLLTDVYATLFRCGLAPKNIEELEIQRRKLFRRILRRLNPFLLR